MSTTRHAFPLPCTLLCLWLAGCELIDYHPYDVRISGETDINATNMAQIESACLDKDTLRFITTGDSQRWYDETVDFVDHVNQRTDIDFVIHGGDLSDFGMTDEFLWQRDILNGLTVPYVALIGNHDCLGTGEDTYQAVFGDPNFSFVAGRVKFVCLNTNALEYDYSTPVPDFDFIANEQTDRADEFDRTVVCMHVRPYADEFNNNVAEVFEKYRNQWETDVLFGFLPKFQSDKAKATFTLKQNYIPWSLQVKESRFAVEPLTCGMYFNTVFGKEFWVNEPDRYPKGYYGFSSKVRIHIFLGQRLTYDIAPDRRFFAKAVTLFYEISTCDLYIVSAFTNRYLKPKDYLSLSFGLKLQLL